METKKLNIYYVLIQGKPVQETIFRMTTLNVLAIISHRKHLDMVHGKRYNSANHSRRTLRQSYSLCTSGIVSSTKRLNKMLKFMTSCECTLIVLFVFTFASSSCTYSSYDIRCFVILTFCQENCSNWCACA